MRVIGYLILLLLALYFTLVKPYLLAKRIHWEIYGLSLSFKEGLSFESFLFYLPTENMVLYVHLRGLSLKPWEGKAKEFNLIEVSKKPPSDKPFDYDFTYLVKLANRVNLKAESLYISTNYVPYGESLTLFIPKTEIKSGVVSSYDWTKVYWMHYEDVHQLEVFLHKAYARRDGIFLIDKAQVRSGLYYFDLQGLWKGKRGNFSARGRIEPIKGENFYVGGINLELKGDLEYTKIRAKYYGELKELEIKERREYKNIKVDGEYLWEWRGKNQLKAKLWDGKTKVDINYSLKDGFLEGEFRSFPLDSRLLGLKEKVWAVVNGSIKVRLKEKLVELQAYTSSLEVEERKLEKASLKLKIDYKGELKGSFDFLAPQPFYVGFTGSFLRRDITGNLLIMGYPLYLEGFSSNLSYTGSLIFKDGTLYLDGKGRLLGMMYKGLSLGSASYSLNFKEDSYRIDLKGEGFSLFGEGSLRERNFNGRALLEGMDISYLDVNAKSIKGSINIEVLKDHLKGSGNLSGLVSKEEISSWISLNFDLVKEGNEIMGKMEGSLKDTKLGPFAYEEGIFQAKWEGEKLFFSFDFKEELSGKGFYSLREGTYDLEGSLKYNLKDLKVKSSYQVKGFGKIFKGALKGEGRYREFSFPIKGTLSLKKDQEVEGFLEGFSVRDKVVALRVGGVKFWGDVKKGSIEILPILITVGDETFSRVDFQEGSYEGKRLHLQGKISGVAEGILRINYIDSLEAFLEGTLDLGKISSLVRSRILADSEGKIFYRFSYTEGDKTLWARGDKLSLRSRYLALPLEGDLEINLKGDRFYGSINFSGNNRSSFVGHLTGDNKEVKLNFEVSQMPILLRQQNIRGSLLFSGKGSVSSDFRNLRISGEFFNSGFLNLKGLGDKRITPSEEYKRIILDLKVTSLEPLRISLPEGFIYTDIIANIKGTLYEPEYRLQAYFKGGNLSYFNRNFHVRRGEALFTNKEQILDLTVITPTPDYSIIIDIKGNPQYPKAIVRSEPPKDIREVLTTLVLGGRETEGLIPVTSALLSQLPQFSNLFKGANRLTGLDVKVQVSPALSPTGEVGINTTISKDLTERISVEHKQSTLKNPKETHTGGEVKLAPGTSVGARLYSDKSQEYKIRVRRKFDF